MQLVDQLYLKRQLAHGGDQVLTWCASNVVARRDENDNIAPSKKRSQGKIDDYSALLNAVAAHLKDKPQGDLSGFFTEALAA